MMGPRSLTGILFWVLFSVTKPEPKRPVGRPPIEPTKRAVFHISARVDEQAHAKWLQIGASAWLKEFLKNWKP